MCLRAYWVQVEALRLAKEEQEEASTFKPSINPRSEAIIKDKVPRFQGNGTELCGCETSECLSTSLQGSGLVLAQIRSTVKPTPLKKTQP